MTIELHLADCREVLRSMADCSVDAVVSDPPYEQNFMGAGWDSTGIAFDREVWTEVRRVLKPGGHALAFGGTTKWHWLACAMELAGLESRGSIAWLFAQGMPHGLDFSKALDKARHDRDEVMEVTGWIAEARDAAGLGNRDIDHAFGFNGMAGHWTSQGAQPAVPTLEQIPALLALLGVEDPPERIRALLIDLNSAKGQPGPNWWKREHLGTRTDGAGNGSPIGLGSPRTMETTFDVTAPATPEAEQWAGWNTQIAPAHEPIAMFRRPLEGTHVENLRRWGVGGLNVDGCRLEGGKQVPASPAKATQSRSKSGADKDRTSDSDGWDPTVGRWPPNVALDEAVAAQLDAMVARQRDGVAVHRNRSGRSTYRVQNCPPSVRGPDQGFGGGGGPSRFFYCPKAATRERDAGCEHLRWVKEGSTWRAAEPGEEAQLVGNCWATVKPLELIRWLVRLVTPPGGLVLDMFLGSGTTGVAAVCEGMRFIGCDSDPVAHTIASARIAWAQGRGLDLAELPAGVTGQGSLF